MSNAAGVVVERMAYDPWGKRRFSNGTNDRLDALYGVSTDRGYTMHEHLDEMGIIHMNGRVYDPLNGRFMSSDPIIQEPGNLQSYNRYAYVFNNPLLFTDPSGYSAWTKFRDRVLKPVAFAYIGYLTGGLAMNAIIPSSMGVAGGGLLAVGGAVGGFTAGALSTGTFKGAVQGAFTGALFGAAGTVGGMNDPSRYLAHAGAGCVSAVAGGGNCGQGAASAVFGKFTSNNINIQNDLGRGIAVAVAGGVGSVIGGGKFENGAVTAAFGYVFNECLHGGCGWSDTKVTIAGNYAAGPVGQYGTYPSSLHLEIRISNGYDTITIEGQPGSYSLSKGLKLVTGSDNPHPAPVFSMELPIPNGMSMQQLATNLVEAAKAYQNNLPYNFPLAGTGAMMWGYNSNSHVSGILQRATGQYQSGVVDAARRAGFLVPGFSRPIPIVP